MPQPARFQSGVYPLVAPVRTETWEEARAALVAALERIDDPAAPGMINLIPDQAECFAEHVTDPFWFAYITPFDSQGRVIHH